MNSAGSEPVADALAGRQLPRKALVLALVRALGVPTSDRRWEMTWTRLADQASKPRRDSRGSPPAVLIWSSGRTVGAPGTSSGRRCGEACSAPVCGVPDHIGAAVLLRLLRRAASHPRRTVTSLQAASDTTDLDSHSDVGRPLAVAWTKVIVEPATLTVDLTQPPRSSRRYGNTEFTTALRAARRLPPGGEFFRHRQRPEEAAPQVAHPHRDLRGQRARHGLPQRHPVEEIATVDPPRRCTRSRCM